MYIVFKSMDEWLEKEPDLEKKYRQTYDFIYKGASDYAVGLHKNVKEKIGYDVKVDFSENLFRQALVDAFDDLMRLKNYHPTDEPNPIKEMSYIVYWIMRHKPIRLVTEEVISNKQLSKIARTRLLFINETFGVKLLINAAFEGARKIKTCSHMLEMGEKQMKYFKQFLLYYLVYRVDSPKSLEAMMMACTIHPVWEVNPVIWNEPQVTEEDF